MVSSTFSAQCQRGESYTPMFMSVRWPHISKPLDKEVSTYSSEWYDVCSRYSNIKHGYELYLPVHWKWLAIK